MVSKFQEANQLLRTGNLKEAVAAYRLVIEENPGFYWAYQNLGETLCQLKRWDEAVEAFRQAVVVNPGAGWSHICLGQVFAKQQQWEKAIASYQQALGLQLHQPEVFYELGIALAGLKRWDEAVEAYRRAIERDDSQHKYYHHLGDARLRQGELEEAIACYQKALELNPISDWSHYNLGQALEKLGRTEEAIACYQKAAEIQPNLVRKRLVTEPRDKTFGSTFSENHRLKVTQNNQVEPEESAAFSLYEQNLFKSAKSHLLKQEYDQVIDSCSKIIAANPILTDVFPVLGAAYHKNNQLQEAEDFLRTTQHIRHLIAAKTVEQTWGPVISKFSEGGSGKIVERQKQKRINKIVIYTCVWRRPELTRIVLSYYSHLKKELSGKIQLELLAVGSEGNVSRKLCEDCGFDYIEYANKPLSAKWEHGINRCADYDPDGVIIVGSDDLISQNLIEFYDSQLKNNMVFCGLKDGYFFDVSKENLILWTGYNVVADPTRVGETIGMGRCLSRILLDKLGFSIWKGLDINQGLDGAMTQTLFQLGLQMLDYNNCVVANVDNHEVKIGHCGFEMAEIGGCAVDLKFAENLTTFDRYGKRSLVVNQDHPWEILSKFFPVTTTTSIKQLLC
ncbi:tetratricopeptide repeat protein [Capilliphycus salinus ALCB114379]|uniref:tetratricopeptide repeat protein n=1 Tax=Capilliphycus salinus TaxID=2768948 RepID=UPI0039A68131